MVIPCLWEILQIYLPSEFLLFYQTISPSRVAQSVTCLVTDAKLTAYPGVASSIPARYHTFVEIDHEIISTVILLPSAESLMKGCCQLQAKVCARLLVNCLFKLAQEKSVVRWTDRPAMTIAVDLGPKATNQTNKTNHFMYFSSAHVSKIFHWTFSCNLGQMYFEQSDNSLESKFQEVSKFWFTLHDLGQKFWCLFWVGMC